MLLNCWQTKALHVLDDKVYVSKITTKQRIKTMTNQNKLELTIMTMTLITTVSVLLTF